MPAGTVIVKHNLTVGPKALLDAVTPGDPAGANAQLPATVLVRGSVNVGQGGVLLVGCLPDQNPTLAVNYDRIGGNLTGFGALAIVVHSATIRGSVSLFGGGGGVGGGHARVCPPSRATARAHPTAPAPPAPWPGGPVFSDFEDSTIGGNYTVVGLRTCWFGTFRTTIGGSTTLVGNRTGDPDGNEIATNRTGGNMVCLSVLPAVQFGDSGGSPNIVGHSAIGDCGFNVMKPNDAPESRDPGHQNPYHGPRRQSEDLRGSAHPDRPRGVVAADASAGRHRLRRHPHCRTSTTPCWPAGASPGRRPPSTPPPSLAARLRRS